MPATVDPRTIGPSLPAGPSPRTGSGGRRSRRRPAPGSVGVVSRPSSAAGGRSPIRPGRRPPAARPTYPLAMPMCWVSRAGKLPLRVIGGDCGVRIAEATAARGALARARLTRGRGGSVRPAGLHGNDGGGVEDVAEHRGAERRDDRGMVGGRPSVVDGRPGVVGCRTRRPVGRGSQPASRLPRAGPRSGPPRRVGAARAADPRPRAARGRHPSRPAGGPTRAPPANS